MAAIGANAQTNASGQLTRFEEQRECSPPVSAIEAALLCAWPALETVEDGQWSARFSQGLSRRANSIQCNDPADDGDIGMRLARLAALYRTHDLPCCFRVTPLTPSAVFTALEDWNWPACDRSLVLETMIGRTSGIDGDCVVTTATDAGFVAAQTLLQGYDPAKARVFAAIVGNIQAPAAGLTFYSPDRAPLASLLCVETGGIGVFLNVVTDSHFRGRGLGRRAMTSGLSWLAENGASHAALQVFSGNRAGIALYLKLGFAYRYPYHYRFQPEVGLA